MDKVVIKLSDNDYVTKDEQNKYGVSPVFAEAYRFGQGEWDSMRDTFEINKDQYRALSGEDLEEEKYENIKILCSRISKLTKSLDGEEMEHLLFLIKEQREHFEHGG